MDKDRSSINDNAYAEADANSASSDGVLPLGGGVRS